MITKIGTITINSDGKIQANNWTCKNVEGKNTAPSAQEEILLWAKDKIEKAIEEKYVVLVAKKDE
jgi:hypothetical protein